MIFSQFIRKIGEPVKREYLLQYIIFCKEKIIKKENISLYKKVEKHHVLPKSIFKEFLKEIWNIVPLIYEDHIEAHKMLIKAYPIRKFIRPLNYMLNYDKPEEFKKMKSEEVKEWWKQFKKTEGYKIWKEKRKESTNNFEKLIKSGIQSSVERNSSEEYRNIISKKCKSFYDNKENRKKQSECIKKAMTDEVKDKISDIVSRRWMDDNFKNQMINKMKEVNSNLSKREKNSKTAKENWKDEEFRKKMMKSRKNGKKRNIKSQSNKMKEKWSNPEFRKMMIEKRKRKYETN